MFTLLSILRCKVISTHTCDVETRLVSELLLDLGVTNLDTNKKNGIKVCVSPVLSMKGKGFRDLQDKHDLAILKDSENKLIEFSPEYASLSCASIMNARNDYGSYLFSPLMVKGKDSYVIVFYNSLTEQFVQLYSYKANKKCEILDLKIVDGHFRYLK